MSLEESLSSLLPSALRRSTKSRIKEIFLSWLFLHKEHVLAIKEETKLDSSSFYLAVISPLCDITAVILSERHTSN